MGLKNYDVLMRGKLLAANYRMRYFQDNSKMRKEGGKMQENGGFKSPGRAVEEDAKPQRRRKSFEIPR